MDQVDNQRQSSAAQNGGPRIESVAAPAGAETALGDWLAALVIVVGWAAVVFAMSR